MELKHKTVHIDRASIKADSPHGGFKGYASVFGVEDSYGESTVKGCFKNCLPSFLRDGWIAVGHDWMRMGCGFVNAAAEDDYGLLIDVDFHSDAESQAVRTKVEERIRAGKSVSLSIGYYLVSWEMKDRVMQLTEVDLREVSIVNVPANPAAILTGVKNGMVPIDRHGVMVADALKQFYGRVSEHESERMKESRELSASNVATIDALVTLYEGELKTHVDKLKELADRNRKSSETDDNKGTETEPLPTEAELLRDHHLRMQKWQELELHN